MSSRQFKTVSPCLIRRQEVICGSVITGFSHMHVIIFTRQSTASFFCLFFIFRANQTLIAFASCCHLAVPCCRLNCFFNLRSYLTQNTISTELFLQSQRIAHRQYGRPVTMATVVRFTHIKDII